MHPFCCQYLEWVQGHYGAYCEVSSSIGFYAFSQITLALVVHPSVPSPMLSVPCASACVFSSVLACPHDPFSLSLLAVTATVAVVAAAPSQAWC